MNARRYRGSAAPSLALIGLALTGIARAQQTSAQQTSAQQPSSARPDAAVQRARADLAEAHKLGKRGDFEGACALFERSAEQAPTADALLNAGICREYHGELVAAVVALETALEASQGRPRQQASIQPRIDALLPRIATVRIGSPRTADVVVEVDAQVVRHFDVPLRLNPGEHQLRATAPRARSHSETFTLTAGQALDLAIPALEPDVSSAVQPPTPVKSTETAVRDFSGSPGDEPARAWRKPLVIGGIGLVVAGGAYSVWQFISMSQARSRKHDLSDQYGCNIDGDQASDPSCDVSIQHRIGDIYYDEEEPARKRAWIGIAASGVGAGLALVSYFVLPAAGARSGEPRSLARRLQPQLELGPGLCTVRLGAGW